jgi:hypothetical protein
MYVVLPSEDNHPTQNQAIQYVHKHMIHLPTILAAPSLQSYTQDSCHVIK